MIAGMIAFGFGFIGVVIVFSLAMLSLGLNPVNLIVIVVIVSLLVGCVGWFYYKVQHQANKQQRSLNQAGDYLVKWEYSAAEWRAYIKDEAIRGPGKALQPLIYMGLALFILLILFTTIPSTAKGNPLNGKVVGTIFAMLIGMSLVVGGAVFLYYWLEYLNRRRKTTDTVYFWPDGVYQDDNFVALAGLRSMELIEGKSLTVLQFNCSIHLRRGSTSYNIRVGVPEGKEDEAGLLIQILEASSSDERETLIAKLKKSQASSGYFDIQ